MKLKFKNIFLIGFLAIASVFGAFSAVIATEKANDTPVMEKAEAIDGNNKIAGSETGWSASINMELTSDSTTAYVSREFKKDEQFKVVANGSWKGDDFLIDNTGGQFVDAGGSGDNNIKCKTAGTYTVTWNGSNIRTYSGTVTYNQSKNGWVVALNNSGGTDFSFSDAVPMNDTPGSGNVAAKKGITVNANAHFQVAYGNGFGFNEDAGSWKTGSATTYISKDATYTQEFVVALPGTIDVYLNNSYVVYPTLTVSTTSITFDRQSGTGGTGNTTVTYGNEMPAISVPTRTNYTFGGYYTETGGSGTQYYKADGTSAKNWDLTDSSKTLYAQWTANPVITKYEVVDGESPSTIGAPEVVAPGTNYPVPAKIYKGSYTFDGWFTDSSCNTPYTARSINSNLNLYAKYTSHAAWTGTIHIDLRDSGWGSTAGNYAVYFWNNTYSTDVNGWSSYITGTNAGTLLVEASYSLPFEPLKMIIVRYPSTNTESSWSGHEWDNTTDQTQDADYNVMARIGNTKVDGKNIAYYGYPKLCIWGPDSETYLNNVKLAGDGHAEYFIPSITLQTDQEFKVQIAPYAAGDYFASFWTHDSIKDNFSGDQTNNIRVIEGGTYAIYFDYYDTKTIYITTVAAAEADEWAQYFLANVGCDATGVKLPSGWSSCASEYAELSGDAKDIVFGTTAGDEGYIPQAVKRYDQAIRSHPSLTKFIVNSKDTPRDVSAYRGFGLGNIFGSDDNNVTTIIIVVASSVALLSVTALSILVIKKRKNMNHE